jgi:Eukaryotic porin
VYASYYQRVMDTMQFGVELMRNARNEVMTTLAYQLEVSNRFIMRAQVDTNWTATAVIERRLGKTVPFTLTISTVLDCLKSQTGIGVGLNLGGGY